MLHRILVPLDGTPWAEAVLPHAQALAEPTHAHLHLLRVAQCPVEFIFCDPAIAPLPDDPGAYLRQVAAPLRRAGCGVVVHLAGGRVADAILAYAEALQADLIAMATHGRSGFARSLVGSVADEIVRRAQVPILLVHPMGHAQAVSPVDSANLKID
jgi:nucleotide-binding universal stress UspA family protein